jgi:hypothetical protein
VGAEMLEFELDEEGENFVLAPATVEELCGWANDFQKRFFHNLKTDMKIVVSPEINGLACFDYTKNAIYITNAVLSFRKTSKIALLHEMIHINLYAENADADPKHGHRFQAEIDRLFNSGAYKGLL